MVQPWVDDERRWWNEVEYIKIVPASVIKVHCYINGSGDRGHALQRHVVLVIRSGVLRKGHKVDKEEELCTMGCVFDSQMGERKGKPLER